MPYNDQLPLTPTSSSTKIHTLFDQQIRNRYVPMATDDICKMSQDAQHIAELQAENRELKRCLCRVLTLFEMRLQRVENDADARDAVGRYSDACWKTIDALGIRDIERAEGGESWGLAHELSNSWRMYTTFVPSATPDPTLHNVDANGRFQ